MTKPLHFFGRFLLTLAVVLLVGFAFASLANDSGAEGLRLMAAFAAATVITVTWSIRQPAANTRTDTAELKQMLHALQADRQPPQTTANDKRKRETLDNVLRDLSDEQLETLRQRLRDGRIDDELLYQRMVDADATQRRSG